MTTTTVPVPFTVDDYADRLIHTIDQALAAGLDGVVVTPGPELVWLTGYRPPASTERLTALVVTPGLVPALLVPVLERPDAEAAAGADNLEIVDWPDIADPYQLVGMLLRPNGTFGISDSARSIHLLELLKDEPDRCFRPLSLRLPMLRAVKDDNEIARLMMASAAADAAYREIVHVRFAGRRECDIAADLARLLEYFGHEQTDIRVAGSGPGGANRRDGAGERIIRPGDAVMLDFGGLMHGYGSGTTRTVSVGKRHPEVSHVHHVVRAAQEAAFLAVRPGVRCEEIDRAARAVIADAGYGEYFVHSTGHGVGLSTHEPPYLVEGERQPLQPGMCLSIGPGIHLPGRFGVRIEDVVVVTEAGGLRLNNTERGLVVAR